MSYSMFMSVKGFEPHEMDVYRGAARNAHMHVVISNSYINTSFGKLIALQESNKAEVSNESSD